MELAVTTISVAGEDIAPFSQAIHVGVGVMLESVLLTSMSIGCSVVWVAEKAVDCAQKMQCQNRFSTLSDEEL